MRSGDDFLAAAAENAAALHDLDEARGVLRSTFLANLLEASNRNKTQQQLADACGYSRQRIAQFLKEARR